MTFQDSDGMIGGWFLTCKTKGYTIFCTNDFDSDPLNVGPDDNYCLYVDDDKGEVRFYAVMTLPNQGATGAYLFNDAWTLRTGINADQLGWHVFAVSFKSRDTIADELVSTDFQIYFGTPRWGAPNDGIRSYFKSNVKGAVKLLGVDWIDVGSSRNYAHKFGDFKGRFYNLKYDYIPIMNSYANF